MKNKKHINLTLLLIAILFTCSSCGTSPSVETAAETSVQTRLEEVTADPDMALLAAALEGTATGITESQTTIDTATVQVSAQASSLSVTVKSITGTSAVITGKTAAVTKSVAASNSITSLTTTKKANQTTASGYVYAGATTTTKAQTSAATSSTTTTKSATTTRTTTTTTTTQQQAQRGTYSVTLAKVQAAGSPITKTVNILNAYDIDNGLSGKTRTFTGVLLKDFLAKEGVNISALGSGATIVAIASDGTAMTYNRSQIVDSNTLLAWEESGQSMGTEAPRLCPCGSTGQNSDLFLKGVASITLNG